MKRLPASALLPTDITFELSVLARLAASRSLPHELQPALHEAREVWGLADPKPSAGITRRMVASVALGLAIALAPLAAEPVHAVERVSVTVLDARTGKPVPGAQIRDEQGRVLATTGPEGKAVLNVPENGRVWIERQGYRPHPMRAADLGENNLVSLRASTATPAPATPTPATPAPTQRATPRTTMAPTPAPRVEPTPRQRRTPTPAPATPPAVREERRTAAGSYTVRSGDTLWDIAGKLWGDPTKWPALYLANRSQLPRPGLLRPGQVLVVPSAQTATRVVSRRYVVARGDTLWEIAAAKLGNPLRWREIYRLNRAKIRSPRLLKPGTVLELP